MEGRSQTDFYTCIMSNDGVVADADPIVSGQVEGLDLTEARKEKRKLLSSKKAPRPLVIL